ncbi:hypothetical protein NITHO_3070025 [Nitrolancea hollandica Lb]|uniref:Uncharacterized protein n=1 Tax=Nitrolancea hollandica Lb TaxID=1129897 RepID=I4EHD7_9BACT|nr:hypothetical protein NITHO_3070025 [Nitrolancea hollandica Lb]
MDWGISAPDIRIAPSAVDTIDYREWAVLVRVDVMASMVVGFNKPSRAPFRLIERSTAGLLIVLLTVIGLLNIPTDCRCGSTIAHPHSLFLIPHHHHDDGHADTGHAHGSDLHVAEAVGVSGDSGPVIRSLTASFSTDQPFANPSPLAAWNLGSVMTWNLLLSLPALLGLATPPEPPPPRLQG